MSQQISIKAVAGLAVQSNSFTVPDGSFEVLNNAVVSSDNIIKKRRGFAQFTSTVLTTPTSLYEYLGTVLLSNNSKLSKLNATTGALTDFAGVPVLVNAGAKPRYAQSNGNLYFTTQTGVLKLNNLTSSVAPSGIPRGLDLEVVLSGQSGIIPPDTQTSYRTVYGLRDVNGNLLLGTPSPIATVTNAMSRSVAASGTALITITTSTPHGLTGPVSIVIKNHKGTGTLVPDGSNFIASTPTASTITFTPVVAPTTTTAVDFGVFKTATCTFSLDSELTTSNMVQIYRSTSSIGETVIPFEDLKIINESPITSAQITAKEAVFTDAVDAIFAGANLYTNPNNETILQANERAPFCTDLAVFKNVSFYANTQSLYRLSASLISVKSSGTPAMVNGDSIAITSNAVTRTYTAASTPSYNTGAGGNFQLTNSSTTVSVSQGIDATCRSLCKTINRDLSSSVYAFYSSSSTDVPGKFILISKTYNFNFSVTANSTTVGGCFQPTLPTSGTSVSGSADVLPNSISFSKISQPEAVPVVNNLTVGSKSAAILRIVPLRDSLIIIKEDGVFKLSGDSPGNFQVSTLDSTIICKAADSVVTLGNLVYFVSNQGVVSISESGSSVISRSIETLLTAVTGKSYFATQTDAVAYESERLYLLSTVSPTSTTADTVYCYNTVTSAWSTWTNTFTDAIVSPSLDVMFTLNATEVSKERKNQNNLDFCEKSYPATLFNITADKFKCELTTPGTIPVVGDIVVTGEVINRITTISTSTGVTLYTFKNRLPVSVTTDGVIYKAIKTNGTTSPLTGGDVSRLKQYSEFQCEFRNQSCTKMNVWFASDSVTDSTVTPWSTITGNNGWGLSPWGQFGWGLDEGINSVFTTAANQSLRVYVPLEAQRGQYLQVKFEHGIAGESIEIQNLSYTVRPYGNRVTK